MQRREFLGAIPAALAAAQAVPMFGGDDAQAGEGAAQGEGAPLANATADDKLRTFLLPHQLRRETIDRFLDPDARVWAKFDPEFGYVLRNSFMRDGVDGCHTLARYAATGQRLQVNFADQPCRINSYGDSFTQGHQVGDGETWQEILSAHFCEPIRNFGIGGFGVYQAYRRLIKTEATELGRSTSCSTFGATTTCAAFMHGVGSPFLPARSNRCQAKCSMRTLGSMPAWASGVN